MICPKIKGLEAWRLEQKGDGWDLKRIIEQRKQEYWTTRLLNNRMISQEDYWTTQQGILNRVSEQQDYCTTRWYLNKRLLNNTTGNSEQQDHWTRIISRWLLNNTTGNFEQQEFWTRIISKLSWNNMTRYTEQQEYWTMGCRNICVLSVTKCPTNLLLLLSNSGNQLSNCFPCWLCKQFHISDLKTIVRAGFSISIKENHRILFLMFCIKS